MMSYLEDAAAELDEIRAANGEMRRRAMALRTRRPCTDVDEAAAAEMEATVTETSFRLASDYITLAVLERDAAPPAVTPDPGQEQSLPRRGRAVHRYLGGADPEPGQERP
jgi:hypothetical protein